MKKLLVICLTVALLAVAALPVLSVSAAELSADEQRVMTALKGAKANPGNGFEYVIPAEYINQAENFFLANDTTAAQADEIIGYINDGIAVMNNQSNYTTVSSSLSASLTQSAKTQLLADGQKACAVVNLTLTYDSSSNVVTIKDAAGKTVFTNTASIIKVTGAAQEGMAWMMIVGAAIVLTGAVAVVLVAARKKSLLARTAA